jgi:siroheme synthase (precorrin-2 oxidase/ferrochelatase)
VHRDGDVVVSVSTEGSSPALAQWVRNVVATALPKNLAAVARRLRAERDALHASGQSTENLAWMQRVEELVREGQETGVDSGPSRAD